MIRRAATHALVVGAEKLSSIVDWSDRTTCVLFGDGAGASCWAAPPSRRYGIIGTRLGAYGDSTDLLCIPAVAALPRHRRLDRRGRPLHEDEGQGSLQARRPRDGRGRARYSGTTSRQSGSDFARHPHQANVRIIEAVSQYLELPMDRFYVNLDRYGNTSSASIPIALDEARRSGRIKHGDLTLLVAFGAGLTYASALIRWNSFAHAFSSHPPLPFGLLVAALLFLAPARLAADLVWTREAPVGASKAARSPV
jgi:3-oxoacyl-[acyl-carrier-protein] synthase III